MHYTMPYSYKQITKVVPNKQITIKAYQRRHQSRPRPLHQRLQQKRSETEYQRWYTT